MIKIKAKEWLKKYSTRGKGNVISLDETWHMGLDALCKYMEEYALYTEPVSEDYKERYEEIVNSDWFKVAYDNKPIGDTLKII